MPSKLEVNFLEEAEGRASEIKLSLLIELLKMLERNQLGEELQDWIDTNDPNVIISIKTANAIKQFLLDHNLHKSERLAKVVVLSAHCPCDGKAGGGGPR